MALGRMMDFTVMFIVTTTLVLISSPSTYSQSAPVNLTAILSEQSAPFGSFLALLQSTNAIQILQNQANTQQGLTLFAPNDVAFADDPVPWGTLSAAQTQSLCLFHALPQYYSATGLNTLSQLSPLTTMAGGQYTLNITYVSQTLYLNSGWTSAKVLAAGDLTTYPTQVYQINKVLLPEAIFGTNIPPPPPSSSTPGTSPSSSTTSTPLATPPPPTATTATPASSTPSAPPPPPTTSTPTTTITIAHSASSLRIVGMGGWIVIILGVSETFEPEAKILGLSVLFPDRPDIALAPHSRRRNSLCFDRTYVVTTA
ncbi:hypothetical protein RHMOL_Rhmol04G0069100 [Rhododendron molle]|uniref:Uncharacterized protein n=1 Tax=Rhododendron molle TaxID=49168 RepID=A0ACC0P0A9_RHOML|nr:hypothetical protein RHMOL_Rhmol04G0069100 [Rhododendron molle]